MSLRAGKRVFETDADISHIAWADQTNMLPCLKRLSNVQALCVCYHLRPESEIISMEQSGDRCGRTRKQQFANRIGQKLLSQAPGSQATISSEAQDMTRNKRENGHLSSALQMMGACNPLVTQQLQEMRQQRHGSTKLHTGRMAREVLNWFRLYSSSRGAQNDWLAGWLAHNEHWWW